MFEVDIKKILYVLVIGTLATVWFYGMQPTVYRYDITSESMEEEQGCRIPQIDPFSKEYRHLIRIPKQIIRCDDIISLTYRNGSNIFVNKTAILMSGISTTFSHCVYNEIYRPRKGKKHNYYRYRKFSVFFQNVTAVKSEFIRVICFDNQKKEIHKNFFAFVQQKHVKKRALFEGKKRPNVILLGIDSTSRWNSMRYLRETRKLLHDLDAVEFTGYSTVGQNTFENMVPLLTGEFMNSSVWNHVKKRKRIDNLDFVWNQFKKEGYTTLFVEDTPGYGMFDYGKSGFHEFPTDFFNRHLSVAISRELKKRRRLRRFCINDKFETDINLDYHLQFLNTYRSEAHFSFVFLTELTHDYAIRAASMDKILAEFIKTLRDDGHLENSFLFIFGDHGMRWGPIRKSAIGDIEVNLPMMFIAPPSTNKEEYIKLLRENSQRLSTPFDVHQTLLAILGKESKSNKFGINLFTPIPRGRTCDDAGIPPDCCPCKKRSKIPVTPLLIQIVKSICISKINFILDSYSNKCFFVQLQNITAAYSVLNTHHTDVSEIVFSTTPGNAIFQVQVNKKDDTFHILGDVIRINRYNDQSHCVQDYFVKNYCFCRDKLSN